MLSSAAKDYLLQSIAASMSLSEIKTQVRNAGWSDEERAEAATFLASQLSGGQPPEVVPAAAQQESDLLQKSRAGSKKFVVLAIGISLTISLGILWLLADRNVLFPKPTSLTLEPTEEITSINQEVAVNDSISDLPPIISPGMDTPHEFREITVFGASIAYSTDATGKITGVSPNDQISREEIAGVSYTSTDYSSTFTIPSKTPTTLSFIAKENQLVVVELRNVAKDDSDSFSVVNKAFFVAQATAGDTFALSDTSTELRALKLVRESASGEKKSFPPENIIFDSADLADVDAPITTIQAEQLSTGLYEVRLSAVDAGIGVLKTYYTNDNWLTSNIYTVPFQLTREELETVTAFSIDLAGNSEVSLVKYNQ